MLSSLPLIRSLGVSPAPMPKATGPLIRIRHRTPSGLFSWAHSNATSRPSASAARYWSLGSPDTLSYPHRRASSRTSVFGVQVTVRVYQLG